MPKQWTADELHKMGWSFQAGCILTAAAELDLFTHLCDRPMKADTLAAQIAADPRATTVLLDALTALELLTKQDDTYSVPADAAELLSQSSPANVLPMLRHLGACLRRWAQLALVTRTGRPADCPPGILGRAGQTAAFIAAMNTFSRRVADEVVARLQPLQFDNLLDVGGASGTWTIALLKAAPRARATLFDLPDVIPMARERFAEAGLSDRVTLVAGDFYEDDLPKGADLALLSAIAHHAKVNAALKDAGHLVIRDTVMDPSHTTPRHGALFAVNMLVATPAGGTYSLEEYTEDLEASGFTDITLVQKDEFMNSLIRAKKT